MSDKEVDKDNEETESQGSAFLQNKFLSSRSIIISGEVNQVLAEKVVTQLVLLQSISNDPIRLYINS